ncbi:MAG: lipopolysaccharide heptosyltransferase I [Acidobacteria bacterium]|nr:lipopolysaccharide heptosyltransferase I [Acidobacteriota bacterium]
MWVVLVRLSALGDIVHTWPLAVSLKNAMPSLRLAWVVEERLAPLVDGHPAVDATITVNTRRWRRRPWSPRTLREIRAIRQRLATLGPELCIDPQGVAKSAFMTFLSGASRRVGLARPWRREALAGLAYSEKIRVTATSSHVICTNLEFLKCLQVAPPDEPPAPDGRWLLSSSHEAAHAVPAPGTYALIFPTAGNPAKGIPASILAEVAKELVGRGLQVLIGWGPGEKDLAGDVAGRVGPGARIAPPTTLKDLARLAAGARLVIGGDTGPIHLAASLKTPTVGVFTATDPQRNRPLGAAVEIVSTVPGDAQSTNGSAWVGRGAPPTSAEILAAVRRLKVV